ncbi:hypothetical protein HRR90_003201 [Exophiala dermatitidis]|uniref:VOC domain-containing protein n=2 Tax=Exophiala dermatitidis TaxID=5970 RepID=H6C792_EXODN|nr:uncharacterized protein HMPREF1120_07573 [Exophiala dermatitidis NIH/UT8656]KAJ4522649.1 hypothetical protein HRR75_001043 [Exophiala dermatitidis]EHY59588.1 hypothetical protein HMPREF1120_07573 [Exophiala dermatitidis NIH/UT8656]KAJ4527103.1 hypothetical protein HRR73_001900 [Exophiala dermatitidis]KAJ4532821.1 hypothetical protein HRR76_007801 [Exophiala dermatitidis]KAJ4559616.1 hypothetical protein HRR78_000136 [Exophiala dermatitidis]
MPSSITLTVAHLPTSTSFFLSALQPLNYVFRGRQDQTVGFGPAVPASAPADFWITQEIPGVPAGAAHVAFPAASRAQVEEFFVAALKAGSKIHGEPSQRDASGYFSAAVIDFDGNSIEAVYRPASTTTGDNNDGGRSGSVVSRRSSTKAPPSTIVSVTKSRASAAAAASGSAGKGSDGKSVLTVANKAKGPASTVVSSASRARSKAAAAAPPSVASQARSVTAPATAFYDGPIAFGLPTEVPGPTQMQMQMSSLAEPVNVGGGGVGGSGSGGGGGDVLNALINEARTAASVARDLVNSVKPHLNNQESAAGLVTTDQAAGGGGGAGNNNSNNNGNGAGEAIVGTLLGVAAGAALHYAFSNRSKENGALHHQDQGQTGLDGGGLGGSALQRPSVIGRNVTDATPLPLRTEYAYEYAASSNGDGRGVYPYNNQYYYTGEEESQGHAPQRLITMHDNTSHLSLPAPGPASRAGSKNVKSATGSAVGSEATTVRPVPVPVQVPQSHASASKAASSWSQLSATSSKKSSSTSNMSVKMKMAPPTSYRAPTVLTAAETGLPGGGVAASAAGSHPSCSRSSHSRSRSRATSVGGTKPGSSTRHSSHARSRSQSQSGSHASTIKPVPMAASTTSTSRRSRRDQFEDDRKTIVHVPEQTTSSHVGESHHSTTSKVSHREPHQYPLPPSRAATWAGSDHGAASRGGGGGGGGGYGGSGSLMSSTGRVLPGHPVSAPRTIIGKLNPLHRNSGGGGGGGGGGAAKQNDTVSVVSKQKDLEDLDVTDREVRPEDSVSQFSVGSKGSRRSKRSGTSRR